LLLYANGHISIGIKDSEDQIELRIEDDGPQISEHRINRIFTRRPQADTDSMSPLLQLPIAKELIQMHSGNIWIENGQDKGRALCLTLPKVSAAKLITAAEFSTDGI
jgi:two-component system sensor histidine kinase ChvG